MLTTTWQRGQRGIGSFISLRFSLRTCLASEFAEEVGGLGACSRINRRFAISSLRIHISSLGDQEFDNFVVPLRSGFVQGSPSILVFLVYIRASGQVLFDNSNITVFDCIVD